MQAAVANTAACSFLATKLLHAALRGELVILPSRTTSRFFWPWQTRKRGLPQRSPHFMSWRLLAAKEERASLAGKSRPELTARGTGGNTLEADAKAEQVFQRAMQIEPKARDLRWHSQTFSGRRAVPRKRK